MANQIKVNLSTVNKVTANFSQGRKGDPGLTGVGVVVGGTIGQYLSKLSNTDYDTTWKDIDSTEVAYGGVSVGAFLDTLYSDKVDVSPKATFNVDGGFMIKLTNKTGGVSVKGTVVRSGRNLNNSFEKVTDGIPDTIGIVYENGIADGSECWVVISGIADVYFVNSTVRGYLARTFITSEIGYVTGQALSEQVPSSPFASDKHFCEIGHIIETRTGAGLAKTVLHFN
jgi:hypothetical protein